MEGSSAKRKMTINYIFTTNCIINHVLNPLIASALSMLDFSRDGFNSKVPEVNDLPRGLWGFFSLSSCSALGGHLLFLTGARAEGLDMAYMCGF